MVQCAEGSLIIQIGKEPAGPNPKAEPLLLPGSSGTVDDETAKCQDGYEDVTNIFRLKKATEKSCSACKANTGNKGMMVKSFKHRRRRHRLSYW